jgi:hypothetical protein
LRMQPQFMQHCRVVSEALERGDAGARIDPS